MMGKVSDHFHLVARQGQDKFQIRIELNLRSVLSLKPKSEVKLNKQTQMRVLLDDEAQGALVVMMEALKTDGDFIRINPSRLTSWIVKKFKRDYFERNKDLISQDHFNSKEYLKNIAKNISDSDDLEKVLRETILQLKPARAKSVSKARSQEQKPEESDQ